MTTETLIALDRAASEADEMDTEGRCTVGEVQQARVLCWLTRALCEEMGAIRNEIESLRLNQ